MRDWFLSYLTSWIVICMITMHLLYNADIRTFLTYLIAISILAFVFGTVAWLVINLIIIISGLF